jgi:signal transduction histidine kinase
MRPPKSLRSLLEVERPALRVQLTLLYSGLFLGILAAVLLATNVLFVRSEQRAPTGLHAAPGAATHAFNLGPALIGLAAAAIALLGAWWLAGRFLRPLRAITIAAQEISATNLNRRLDLGGPKDELSELGGTLNDLFARLETSFESQRHFVANASHELRTPLAGQRTLLQVALADPHADTQTLRSTCEEALALSSQQERLIDALLALATSERGIETWEPFDLAQITQTVLTGRKHDAAAKDIQITTTLVPAPVAGDPQLVELLIANLIDNALQHNHPGGHVEISTATSQRRAILTITNTGSSIPTEDVARLLQPFQRLGSERVGNHGLGLGLAIVSAIATAHAAGLSVRPRTDGGLSIEVSFQSTHNSINAAQQRLLPDASRG